MNYSIELWVGYSRFRSGSLFSILLTSHASMFHRIFSILLIGTTLLGSSFCCCTMRVRGAEQAESPCCCCQNSEAQDSCPAKSGGNEGHKCPCREQRAMGATLDISQILPTSPPTKWTVDPPDDCTSDCCMQVDGVSPQGMQLLRSRTKPRPSGAAMLVAHCVRRC